MASVDVTDIERVCGARGGVVAMRAPKKLARALAVLALVMTTVVATPVTPALAQPFPDGIALPDGFFPEGITIDDQSGVGYVGSLVGGAIQQIDLRTGASNPFAPPVGPAALAVGMALDGHGRLWVATGGPVFGPAIPGFRVYDTATGELVVEQTVAAGFVNDVWVTDDAAWLTDSFSAQLIRVPIADDGTIGTAENVPLGGDWVQTAGFGANGIVATPDERHLIVVQSTGPDAGSSALYVMPIGGDPTVLAATRVSLGEPLLSGDGLVLVGRTLYVVGGPGVTKLKFGPGLTNATIVDVLSVPDAVTPTTADARGSRLYVVDAKFPFLGDPTTPFQVTSIPR